VLYVHETIILFGLLFRFCFLGALFLVLPSFFFSFMDRVRFSFFPMVTDKGTSLFLKFTEIYEIDGRNGLFVIVGKIANIG
jgi:hypothetical protein